MSSEATVVAMQSSVIVNRISAAMILEILLVSRRRLDPKPCDVWLGNTRRQASPEQTRFQVGGSVTLPARARGDRRGRPTHLGIRFSGGQFKFDFCLCRIVDNPIRNSSHDITERGETEQAECARQHRRLGRNAMP